MKNKRKISVEDVWLDDILKMLKVFSSERNNAHHFKRNLSIGTVPSGMQVGYGDCDKVVIKPLSSIKYTQERIVEIVEIIREHIHIMQEDLGEREHASGD